MYVLLIILILILAVLILSRLAVKKALRVTKKRTGGPHDLFQGEQYDPFIERSHDLIYQLMSVPYETVRIKSRDGLRLFGRFYPGEEDKPVNIMFHGYMSAAERDMSGGALLAMREGQSVLLVDQRAHGRSGGKYLTFGVKESLDCLDWIHYVNNKFGSDKKIVLTGMSMGASTVLMAAAQSENRISAVAADCGYSDSKAIIKKVIKEMKLPAGISYAVLCLGAKLFCKVDLSEGKASEMLKTCTVPILFIHGDDDRFVPYEMAKENYAAAAGEKELLTVPGAGHGLSFLARQEEYERRVLDFWKRNV